MVYRNPVGASLETQYVSAAEPNRLMPFGETVAVYCRERHICIVVAFSSNSQRGQVTSGARTAVIFAESAARTPNLVECPLQKNCDSQKKKKTCPESLSELYRPSDRRLSAKLVPTFAEKKGCSVVSAVDPLRP
jgi:hypothetical protein